MPSTNKIPNQNDLFSIFQAQVETISQVTDIIMKSKINNKTAKKVSEVSENMVIIGAAIVDMIESLPEASEKSIEKFTNFKTRMMVVAGDLHELIDVFNSYNLLEYIDARLGIWRMRKTMKAIKRLVGSIELITPVSLTLASTVVRGVTKTAILMAKMTRALRKIPLWGARVAVKRLFRVLFGHKPGVLKKPTDAGLIDIFEKINKPHRLKALLKAKINVNLIVGPTKKLIGLLALMGLALAPIALAWLTIKIMKPIIKGLLWVFRKLSHNLKRIFKGSIAMRLMVASLLIFTAGMALVGLGVMLAWKPMALSVLFVALMITFFALIASRPIRRRIRRGAKTILMMAKAVALIGLVAIGLALLSQFITVNLAGFAQTALFILALIGGFWLLSKASRKIRKGYRNILRIALGIALLALVAIGLALLSQFVRGNLGGFMVVALWILALITLAKYIGKQSKAIMKAESAMILLGLFAAGVAAVAIVMMLVTHMGNIWELLGLTTVMFVLIGGLIEIAKIAGKNQAQISAGTPAMMELGIIAGILSVVMILLATAAAISNPLILLAFVGIMSLVIAALGALAFAAGSLILGPQKVVFEAGMVALALIAALCALIGVVAMVMAKAAKEIESTGFTSGIELAHWLNIPFAAIVRGDETGETIFDILLELPNPVTLAYMAWQVGNVTRTVSHIGTIADTLQHIASLNMPDPEKGWDKNGKPLGWKQMKETDFADAAVNASVILGMCSAMFKNEATEFELSTGKKFTVQPISKEGLDAVSNRVKRKVRRLAKIVGSVGRMADTIQHIASLRMPDPDAGYNEDGKPKNWKLMTSDDFKTASQNASSILSFFCALFADKSNPVKFGDETVEVQPLKTELLDNINGKLKRKMKRLGTIVDTIGGMATTIQNVASLNMPDPDKGFDDKGKPLGYIKMEEAQFQVASENIGKIATHIIEAVASPNMAKLLDDMSRKAAKNFERIMNPMQSISGIVEVIQLLAGGEYVKEWQDDPDNPGQRIPKTYESFTKILDQKDKLTDNLSSMLTIVIGAVAQFNEGEKEDLLTDAYKASKDMKKLMENVSPILNDIVGIIKTSIELPPLEEIKPQIQTPTWMLRHTIWAMADCSKIVDDAGKSMSDMNLMLTFIGKPTGRGALATIKDIVDLYNEDISKIGDPKAFKAKWTGPTQVARELIESLAGATSKASAQKVQAIQANIRETIKLMKQVGSTDLNKLKQAAKMMDAIARISESIKGNFKALSKTISKDLLGALEKLRKTLEDIKKNGVKVGGTGGGENPGGGNNPSNPSANNNGSKKVEQNMNGVVREYGLDEVIDLLAACITPKSSTESSRVLHVKYHS